MIFNLSQGGVSTLAVTAPTGASISASCQGLTVTGTGTCTLDLPIIGTWTITCVYDGVTKSTTQEVTSYGVSYSATFAYTATLIVTTFPGATVAISKTGHSDSKTATGGTATFTIPAGQLGTYSITSTYSSWSGSSSKNVAAYDTTYDTTVDLSVCDFKFIVGGTTYTFTKDSTTGSNGDYYFYKSGANWEFYMKNSGTLSFTAATVIDLFLLGGGNDGRNPTGINNGCSGGNGGKRRTVSNITRSGNNTVTVGSAGNDSSLYSYSSSSGTASAGGGQNNWTFYAGENGGYCFNDSSAKGPDGNSRLVGAGGGHGAYAETDGTSQGSFKVSATNGGSYGAGNGGDAKIDGVSWYGDNGGNASYYGAGGGGAGGYYHMSISDRRGKGNPGSGYKGFVAIRNKR